MLEMYIDSPVEAAEREQLVTQLQAALRTPRDRDMAISALENIIRADSQVTDQELAAVDEIKTALEAVHLGGIGRLGRLVRGSVSQNMIEREQYLDDFIKNKVYYAVQRRSDLNQIEWNLPEAELRRLTLAGTLMAQVAQVDREVKAGEFDQMVDTLRTVWDISPEAAAFVTTVAVSEINPGEDHFRVISELANCTTLDERARFLEVLFAVARADSEISFNETETIRTIADILLVPHKQFIEAKLKISHR
jgi:uncharacterized tellurite resistance protein B-like protein